MTISLPNRVRALRDRLVALDQLAAGVDETRQLEDLRTELAQPASVLNQALVQRELLISAGIPAASPATLDSARRRAAALVMKFRAEKKAVVLKKGTGWTHLIRDVNAASRDVAEMVVKTWKAYRQEVFTGEAPGVLKGHIALTPANGAAFKRYEQLYQAFKVEFERPPASRASIERARSLAAQLTDTVKEFDFDVPAEVKRFLEAVQSGGAALDLLTDTVRIWLSDNNALATYRIVPRGVDEGR